MVNHCIFRHIVKKKKKKIGAYFSLGERGKRDEGSTQMIKLQNKILEKWVN